LLGVVCAACQGSPGDPSEGETPAAGGSPEMNTGGTPPLVEPEPIVVPPPPGAGDPVGCARLAPTSPVIVDFSVWNGEQGSWGDASAGQLAGGSFAFGDVASDSLVSATVDTTATNPVLHLTGSVTTSAGFALWFDQCVDASAYAGVSLQIGGSTAVAGATGGEAAVLELQAQTNGNYPVDEMAGRGACAFVDVRNKWNECVNSRTTISVPAVPEVVEVTWPELVGGLPSDGAEPSELLGVEFKFVCGDGTTTCTIDVVVDDVSFALGAAPAAP
jgi:hypothetical protein